MERTVSKRLSTALQRVEQWRAFQGGSGRGSRIPEELWNAAVKVARVEGLYATARTLRFDYERLKKRVNRAPGVKGKEVSDGKAAFVELGMDGLSGGGKAVVELASRHGDRMRIEVTGARIDVAGVAQMFWSRQP